MAFNDIERKRIENKVKALIEARRPPIELRKDLDLFFTIEEYSVVVYEIRSSFQDKDKKIEIPMAKATYIKSRDIWKIYWQRADLKWHSYEPLPECDTIDAFLDEVNNDPYACFWG